jgi:quinol monooxygenase YgiN
MIARHYRLEAKDGMAEALAAACRALADSLARAPGFQGAELSREAEAPGAHLFIERWASAEAHKAGSEFMSKDALGQMMACLAAKPGLSVHEVVAVFAGKP